MMLSSEGDEEEKWEKLRRLHENQNKLSLTYIWVGQKSKGTAKGVLDSTSKIPTRAKPMRRL